MDNRGKLVFAMSSASSAFDQSVREAVDTATRGVGADVTDMPTEISRGIEQWL